MSGVAGGDRIEKKYVDDTFAEYEKLILSKIDGYKGSVLSGSLKSRNKDDYGDIDLVTFFEKDTKKEVKSNIIDKILSMSDDVIVPFKSKKHLGKRYYNSGEIITVLFPISNTEKKVQIDNIIALSEEEQEYKSMFLDLTAEVQGLLLGLAKCIVLEEGMVDVFERLDIDIKDTLVQNQEYEFNLSSSKLSLRLVTLEGFKEINRKVLWTTNNWADVVKLFQNFDVNSDFEKLLIDIKNKIKKERSFKRIVGVFNSMINISSGEENTEKGQIKKYAIDKVNKELKP